MSLDLQNDYNKAKNQITAVNSYTDLKSQYNQQVKKAGSSLEQKDQDISSSLDQVKNEAKRFKKQVKTQFDQLLDINNVTGGKGANSLRFIKRLLLTTIKNIEPQIMEIVGSEVIKLLGCDQQQTFSGGTYYVKIPSIDLLGMLKKSPTSEDGRLLYEKNPIQVQISPFSMNRELYERIQNPDDSFNDQYTSFYKGQSGQNLFDIQYSEFDDNQVIGPWFKITLFNRAGGNNKIIPFLIDYYKSIKLVEFPNIIVGIMEALSGCISIS